MDIKIFFLIIYILSSLGFIPLKSYNRTLLLNDSEAIPKDIENQIGEALYNSFVQSSSGPLDSISNLLEQRKENISTGNYWLIYTHYSTGLYYADSGNPEEAKKKIKICISLMEKIQNKDSEDYALLALINTLSIRYDSGWNAKKTSTRIHEYAQKAIELDSTNVRGWYMLGSCDFYTPVIFGGGKKASYYLEKAVSLKQPSNPNPYAPEWGREHAYDLLIQYYLKKKDKEKAKKYLTELKQFYPDSFFVKHHIKNLEAKNN